MSRVTPSDIEFLERFESCEIEKSCWSHEAHVRMAWIQLALASSYQEGLERIRAGIRRFNAFTGSQGYHETVTVAFARLIEFRRHAGGEEDRVADFLAANPDLLAKSPPVLRGYYSEGALSSVAARDEFVPPDLKPLAPLGRARLARPEDAVAIREIYAPYVERTAVTFEYEIPSADELRERITSCLAHAPWLVYEAGGGIAGYAYASRHRARAAYQWTVEVSVYVGDAYRRHGVARLLYARLFRELEARGFHVALAGVALPNQASVAFHEAMGFESVGVYRGIGYKLGRWHDVGWWQRRLSPATGAPAPPRPD